MTPLQVPGGIEILVLLLVLLFNLAVIALVVAGGVFFYRRWRGDGGADSAELDALRTRVAELEAQVAELDETGEGVEAADDADDR